METKLNLNRRRFLKSATAAAMIGTAGILSVPREAEAGEGGLATLIDLYILSKQIEGRSAKTLTWYRANLERFARFMNNEVLNA